MTRVKLNKDFRKVVKQRVNRQRLKKGYINHNPEQYSWGGVLSQVGAGAAMGGLGGAAVGGIGALPGAIIGGVGGLFSGLAGHIQEKNQNLLVNKQQSVYDEMMGAQQDQARQSYYSSLSGSVSGAANPYASTFQLGGLSTEGLDNIMGANAELEKGEVYQTPDKTLYKVGNDQRSHAQGGEFFRLPPLTRILGNVKFRCCGGRMAKEFGANLYRGQRRFLKSLYNRPTNIDRQTAEAMLSKIDKEFDTIFMKSELKKQGVNTPKPNLLFS